MTDIAKPHIEQDGKPVKKLSDKHLALARRGAELTRMMRDHKTELGKVNAELEKDLGTGIVVVLPEEIRVPIADMVTTSIGDTAGLKAHLGTRKFNLMVTTTTSHKPTDILLEMAKDSEEVAGFLKTKTSTQIKYIPIKTQK